MTGSLMVSISHGLLKLSLHLRILSQHLCIHFASSSKISFIEIFTRIVKQLKEDVMIQDLQNCARAITRINTLPCGGNDSL
jgi:hypothetical protein